jgi:hypothetical protein
MVGNYENSSSGTSGFLYSGGQYTSLVFPGSDNFTRASGINDSCTVAGDFYDGQGSFHGIPTSITAVMRLPRHRVGAALG